MAATEQKTKRETNLTPQQPLIIFSAPTSHELQEAKLLYDDPDIETVSEYFQAILKYSAENELGEKRYPYYLFRQSTSNKQGVVIEILNADGSVNTHSISYYLDEEKFDFTGQSFSEPEGLNESTPLIFPELMSEFKEFITEKFPATSTGARIDPTAAEQLQLQVKIAIEQYKKLIKQMRVQRQEKGCCELDMQPFIEKQKTFRHWIPQGENNRASIYVNTEGKNLGSQQRVLRGKYSENDYHRIGDLDTVRELDLAFRQLLAGPFQYEPTLDARMMQFPPAGWNPKTGWRIETLSERVDSAASSSSDNQTDQQPFTIFRQSDLEDLRTLHFNAGMTLQSYLTDLLKNAHEKNLELTLPLYVVRESGSNNGKLALEIYDGNKVESKSLIYLRGKWVLAKNADVRGHTAVNYTLPISDPNAMEKLQNFLREKYGQGTQVVPTKLQQAQYFIDATALRINNMLNIFESYIINHSMTENLLTSFQEQFFQIEDSLGFEYSGRKSLYFDGGSVISKDQISVPLRSVEKIDREHLERVYKRFLKLEEKSKAQIQEKSSNQTQKNHSSSNETSAVTETNSSRRPRLTLAEWKEQLNDKTYRLQSLSIKGHKKASSAPDKSNAAASSSAFFTESPKSQQATQQKELTKLLGRRVLGKIMGYLSDPRYKSLKDNLSVSLGGQANFMWTQRENEQLKNLLSEEQQKFLSMINDSVDHGGEIKPKAEFIHLWHLLKAMHQKIFQSRNDHPIDTLFRDFLIVEIMRKNGGYCFDVPKGDRRKFVDEHVQPLVTQASNLALEQKTNNAQKTKDFSSKPHVIIGQDRFVGLIRLLVQELCDGDKLRQQMELNQQLEQSVAASSASRNKK